MAVRPYAVYRLDCPVRKSAYRPKAVFYFLNVRLYLLFKTHILTMTLTIVFNVALMLSKFFFNSIICGKNGPNFLKQPHCANHEHILLLLLYTSTIEPSEETVYIGSHLNNNSIDLPSKNQDRV